MRRDRFLKEIEATLKNALETAASNIVEANKKLEQKRKEYRHVPGFDEHESYRDEGIDLSRLTFNEMRLLRNDLQLIFQDPYSSLNPRMTVGQIIGEGPLAHRFFKKDGPEMQEYVMKVMDECGLAPYMIHRYPHQFSGGQRQRPESPDRSRHESPVRRLRRGGKRPGRFDSSPDHQPPSGLLKEKSNPHPSFHQPRSGGRSTSPTGSA